MVRAAVTLKTPQAIELVIISYFGIEKLLYKCVLSMDIFLKRQTDYMLNVSVNIESICIKLGNAEKSKLLE